MQVCNDPKHRSRYWHDAVWWNGCILQREWRSAHNCFEEILALVILKHLWMVATWGFRFEKCSNVTQIELENSPCHAQILQQHQTASRTVGWQYLTYLCNSWTEPGWLGTLWDCSMFVLISWILILFCIFPSPYKDPITSHSVLLPLFYSVLYQLSLLLRRIY